MGKKGKKGKDAEPSEPPHDPQWEAAVEAQRWDRPPDALPDTAQWPTWGAIRCATRRDATQRSAHTQRAPWTGK